MVITSTETLVIGGGPAGSIASSLLAREGRDVTVLEKEKFPRYHIGESLLTSVIPLLKFIGLDAKVEQYGFVKKYGGFFRLKQDSPPGFIDFSKTTKYPYSYQVPRSEFDQLLLDHAEESGAKVYQETAVTELIFEGETPIAARWKNRQGEEGTISFKYLVDASGLSGFLANKYLQNRLFQEEFANVAIGGYWKNFNHYTDDDGREHEGIFAMEAISDGSGWVWAIPLHTGHLSVGAVLHSDRFKTLRKELGSLENVYKQVVFSGRDLPKMLAGASLDSDLKQWADYSYVATSFSGSNYRLIGDAAGFIDPLFSSGIHLAFIGGLSAAATICGVVKGDCDESQGSWFHEEYIRRAYTRFVIMVAGFYQQIRNQQSVAIKGVDSGNFQRAFDLIQPIVSGNLDLNASEIDRDLWQKTMQFTTDMMMEMHSFDSGNPAAKLLAKSKLEDDISSQSDTIDGWYIRLESGKLGLIKQGKVQKLQENIRKESIKLASKAFNFLQVLQK